LKSRRRKRRSGGNRIRRGGKRRRRRIVLRRRRRRRMKFSERLNGISNARNVRSYTEHRKTWTPVHICGHKEI
jgi:hypothetical protein